MDAQEEISLVLTKLVKVRRRAKVEVKELIKTQLDNELKLYEQLECHCLRNSASCPNIKLEFPSDIPSKVIPSVKELEEKTSKLISEIENYAKLIEITSCSNS